MSKMYLQRIQFFFGSAKAPIQREGMAIGLYAFIAFFGIFYSSRVSSFVIYFFFYLR